MQRKVVRFGPSRRKDFYRLHGEANGAGWCCCVAWWVPTWERWDERTAEENRRLRERLCEQGEYDGYLLYLDGEPVGWCQAGRRDRLEKLRRQFDLAPDPNTWAITCFLIAPGHRRQGHAAYLLERVIRDLRTRGACRVEAYPKKGRDLDPLDLWTGPERMFLAAGFLVIRDDPHRPVLILDLE